MKKNILIIILICLNVFTFLNYNQKYINEKVSKNMMAYNLGENYTYSDIINFTYNSERDIDKAIVIFEDMIEDNAFNKNNAYKRLAYIYKERKEYKKSFYYFKKLCEKKCQRLNYKITGDMARAIKDYPSAINFYELAFNEGFLFLSLDIADLYSEQSDYINAHAWYEKAIKAEIDDKETAIDKIRKIKELIKANKSENVF